MAPVARSGVEASTSTGDETLFGVPKWAVAVAAGGLLAAGVTYYLLKPSAPKKKGGKKKGKKTGESGTDSTASSTTATPVKQPVKKVLIEDVPEDNEVEKDPAKRAVAAKDKGNKYFKGARFELAIQCYTQAIELCPEGKDTDLSTFYQNRAAAYEQLEDLSAVVNDCTMALKYNSKYVKAMERRARALRKQSDKLEDNEKVDKLKLALEDMTGACILDGFQRGDHMVFVDTLIKDLGRTEAKVTCSKRDFSLASKHFIKQYLESFQNDPSVLAAKNLDLPDGANLRGYKRALSYLNSSQFDKIIEACTEELNELTNGEEHLTNGDGADSINTDKIGARLLRATFYILGKKQKEAIADLNVVIQDQTATPEFRSNALIRRASLYIQQCADPEQDPLLCLKDFQEAREVLPTNADVHFHRGQVYLLTEQAEKALEDFNKSVELNPKYPTAYVQKLYTEYRMAMEKNNQSNVLEIVDLFEQAVSKYPDCIETYALFAQILSDQQNFEKADTYYESAMKIDPENANILVHRGLTQLQWKGDIAQAVNYIERAIEVDDKCEFAFETLGTVEVQRGNLKRAIELFEKAIPLANTELEMAHLFGLMDAARAQLVVSAKFGFNFVR